jgi:hypothetical protein
LTGAAVGLTGAAVGLTGAAVGLIGAGVIGAGVADDGVCGATGEGVGFGKEHSSAPFAQASP